MKYLLYLACLFTVCKAESQVIIIKVDTLHTFRHPADLETNDAIDQGKIVPENQYPVCMEFRLDLDRQMLTRITDSVRTIHMPFVYFSKQEDCYNIVVQFNGDGTAPAEYPNYTFARLLNGNYILECRVKQQNEIIGWFYETVNVTTIDR